MADADQEKTEEPTSRRKNKARKDGNVAKSQEISNVLFFLVSLAFFKIFGKYMMGNFKNFIVRSLGLINTEINTSNIMIVYFSYLKSYVKIFIPFGLLMLALAFLASIVQVGWLFTTKPLKPRLDSLNFMKGFKKLLLSVDTIKRFVKGLAKIVVLFLIAYLTLRKEIPFIMNFSDLSVYQIFAQVCRLVTKMVINIVYFYAFFAIGDFIFTKYQHKKKLKMTKQEVKDEMKQMMGDPQIKAKIRSIMMQEARKRMLAEVPEADVVITNPTHIAVALKYNPEKDDAPLVLAKGKRLIAEKIKEIARQHNIPIVEDKPLARMLYKMCQVGQEIPGDLYSAVAEILAHVFKMKNKTL